MKVDFFQICPYKYNIHAIETLQKAVLTFYPWLQRYRDPGVQPAAGERLGGGPAPHGVPHRQQDGRHHCQLPLQPLRQRLFTRPPQADSR